jgi:hypothetical protein
MLQSIQIDQAATGFSRCQAVGIARLVFERELPRLEHLPVIRGYAAGGRFGGYNTHPKQSSSGAALFSNMERPVFH